MVKELGKNARLYLNHMDIYLKSFEMEQTLETAVITSGQYGQDFDDMDPVRVNGQFNLSAYLFDDYKATYAGSAESLDRFFKEQQIDSTGQVVSTPSVMTFSNKSPMGPGDWALITQGFGQMGVAPDRAGLIPIRFQLRETGPIVRGKILEIADINLTNAAPTNNSATVDFGVGGAALYGIRATLHVLNITVNSGAFTDVTAKIESDTVTPVTTGTDRLTFAAFTDKTQEWVDVAGTYAERYHRLVLTATGATFNINVKVAVAAQVS
jgi:hypothetical protein